MTKAMKFGDLIPQCISFHKELARLNRSCKDNGDPFMQKIFERKIQTLQSNTPDIIKDIVNSESIYGQFVGISLGVLGCYKEKVADIDLNFSNCLQIAMGYEDYAFSDYTAFDDTFQIISKHRNIA